MENISVKKNGFCEFITLGPAFSEMFVSCYVHSFVTSEIAGPGMCNTTF